MILGIPFAYGWKPCFLNPRFPLCLFSLGGTFFKKRYMEGEVLRIVHIWKSLFLHNKNRVWFSRLEIRFRSQFWRHCCTASSSQSGCRVSYHSQYQLLVTYSFFREDLRFFSFYLESWNFKLLMFCVGYLEGLSIRKLRTVNPGDFSGIISLVICPPPFSVFSFRRPVLGFGGSRTDHL